MDLFTIHRWQKGPGPKVQVMRADPGLILCQELEPIIYPLPLEAIQEMKLLPEQRRGFGLRVLRDMV